MERQMNFLDPPAASGPPCLNCGADTIISYPPGRGRHHARIDCTRCRAWRWLPKDRGEETTPRREA
jgi:hypothetical protein